MQYGFFKDDVLVDKKEFDSLINSFNSKREGWCGANVHKIYKNNKWIVFGYEKLSNKQYYIDSIFAQENLKRK